MTSKERALTALANQEADRIPIDYTCNPGIDARLKDHFGVARDDNEGLLRALGVDFRGVYPPYVGPELHKPLPERRINMWGIHTRWVEHESGGYWDYCDFPLREATAEEVDAWPLPDPDDFDYSALAAECRQHSDYCIVCGSPGTGDLINMSGMLRGVDQAMIGLALDEPAQLRLMDRKVGVDVAVLEQSLDAAGGAVDLVWMGEDLGSQRGPLISVPMFRKHMRPRQQRIVDMAKSFDVPVMIHSCGSSSWAFEDFIEMGITVVDTLQPEAVDMSPEHLKKTFGGRLVFHGCISTAGPVATGTVEETVAYCKEMLDVMMPGGGYCFAPTHQLQDNSPTENVLAMYETAAQYGTY